MKTILIATDFSLESLNILKKVLKEKNEQQDNSQYEILLVSGYDMGDSIRDLLFGNKAHIMDKICNKEFTEACSIIRNKYPHLIHKIRCDIFSGSFTRVFENYLKAENVDEVYYATSLNGKNKNGRFDLVPFIKKAQNIKKEEIIITSPAFLPEKGKIAEVFVEV
ncbi:hypothetical protein ASG01_04655 [Chryseobacterium sp. Leaf180]|uniref:hypothetical protein n=1 Tax=Chryseobacterium sp. Leaf180 TaxID=1736289 RepID=UPI0006FA3DA2|nr:hypothetical protein [Chryseobacterium sp. Leaf180]KQR95148.1 hypothetical protein ASG01_04655 [Chryseobacterium sp. Leaf180]